MLAMTKEVDDSDSDSDERRMSSDEECGWLAGWLAGWMGEHAGLVANLILFLMRPWNNNDDI